MSNIKLVLTDFDGTVVEYGKHIISDNVRKSVIACEEKGVQVVPITGRYYEMAKPVLELLGFDGYGIFDNGASVRQCKTGELIWSQWMDTVSVKQVAKILAPHSRIIDYTEDHDEHIPADNELERIDALADSPTSHVFGLVKLEAIDQVRADLEAIEGITYYVAPSTHGELDHVGVQITHKLADKYHGAEALRKILEMPKDNILAIGDGDNDLPLFKNASVKVAMGNATELLKSQADYITSTVQQDGFVEAMHKFVL